MDNFKKDLYFAAATFICSALIAWQSFNYPVRSAIFPRSLSLLLLGLSLILFVRGWRAVSKGKVEMEGAKHRLTIWTIAKNPAFILFNALVLYILGIHYVGYLTSTAVFIGTTMFILGQRNPLSVIALTLFFTALLYYVFSRLLSVPLPVGLLF